MTVVSSIANAEAPQRDGRRYVFEAHTDHTGRVFGVPWLAGAGVDPQGQLLAHAAQIEAASTAGEIETNVGSVTAIGSEATITLVYSTAGQNRTALRAAYLSATRVEAVMIGDFLNTLTDGQLQALFSMNLAQVLLLRTNKLGPAAATASSIRSTTGT